MISWEEFCEVMGYGIIAAAIIVVCGVGFGFMLKLALLTPL